MLASTVQFSRYGRNRIRQASRAGCPGRPTLIRSPSPHRRPAANSKTPTGRSE